MDIDTSADQQAETIQNETTPEIPQGPTALEGISEFTFGGEKYTPDGLHKLISEYKGYQGQLTEYNEDKRFRENLEVDLDNVLANPSLVDRFKQIYPKRYHGIVERMIRTGQTQTNQTTQQTQSAPAQAALPREFFGMMDDVARMKADFEQAKVDAASAKLDAILPQLTKKYPLARQVEILARAEGMGDRTPTDADWDRLARECHSENKKLFDQFQSETMKRQIDKGRMGKDIGQGGSTPGHGPRKPGKGESRFDVAFDEMTRSLASR